MTSQEKIAYIQVQTALAMIDAMGMQAENENRKHRGETPAYDSQAFFNLEKIYKLGSNDLIEFFKE